MGITTITSTDRKQRVQYSGFKAIYIGEAQPGTAETEAKWRIRKQTYSGNKVIKIDWAGGTNEFNKKWSERTTYSYS